MPPQKPTLLIICNGLDIGQKHGGAEVFAVELALSLRSMGWRPVMGLMAKIGSSVEQAWQERLEKAGIRVVYLNPGKRRDLFRSLKRAEQLCKEEKISWIHSHSQLGNIVTVGLKWANRERHVLRTVHTSYEWGTSVPAWFLNSLFPHLILPLFLDVQVTVSRTIQKQVNRYVGTRLVKKPAVYIPNALPESWFNLSKQDPASQKREEKHPIIGTVGVLHPNKGQRYLIKAFATVLSKNPQAELWLIGDGPDRATLEALTIQLGISSQVRFWGQRRDLPELFEQMDLFVLASFVEGLPTVIMESIMSRIPVIATDIPGNRELIEPGVTGWLVPPGDALALATVIQHALESPADCHSITEKAVQQMENFRIGTVAQQYERLYLSKLY
jgi:glycosyltransferase involved in cell wall biosynthesis